MKTKKENPNELWCPVCEEHTEHNFKERETSKGRKTAAFYTCNRCGSNTWKPTSPGIYGFVVILVLAFLYYMAFVVGPDIGESLLEILFVQICVLGITCYLVRVAWKNAVHCRKFHKWRKRHYQELIDASRKKK